MQNEKSPLIASDETLLERLAASERAAFGKLVDRYESSLYRYARSLCACDADAEDALQEVFVTLWRRGRDATSPILKLRPWLFQVTRNAALRTSRVSKYQPRRFDNIDDLSTLGVNAGWGQLAVDPESMAALHEDEDTLWAAIRRLSPSDQEILILRDMEEVSGEEAAALLQVTLAAVKSRLHRARLRLMGELREVMT